MKVKVEISVMESIDARTRPFVTDLRWSMYVGTRKPKGIPLVAASEQGGAQREGLPSKGVQPVPRVCRSANRESLGAASSPDRDFFPKWVLGP